MARVSRRVYWKILLRGPFFAVRAWAIAPTEEVVALRDPRLAVEAEAPLRLEEQRHFHHRQGIGSSGQPIQPGCPDADDNLDMVFSYLDTTILYGENGLLKDFYLIRWQYLPHTSPANPRFSRNYDGFIAHKLKKNSHSRLELLKASKRTTAATTTSDNTPWPSARVGGRIPDELKPSGLAGWPRQCWRLARRLYSAMPKSFRKGLRERGRPRNFSIDSLTSRESPTS
jgi:hypothetical protein